jgi:amidohydrolase
MTTAHEIDLAYMVQLRRTLHQHPETAFDLPETCALVRRELEQSQVWVTDKYGKSSFVAVMNDELRDKGSIALRADMDALDVTEDNQVPYRSLVSGKMHACGHDVHTAMLLGVVRALAASRNEIVCRVVFIFQAAEEAGGARPMVEDGVVDQFDLIAGCHVSNDVPVGTIAISRGTAFAASRVFELVFHGRTAHAALPDRAIDAIRMGVAAFERIHEAAKEACPAEEAHILSVCIIEGGRQTNLIADSCSLKGTIRTETDETMNRICRQVEQAASHLAQAYQGSCVWQANPGCPALVNDPRLVVWLQQAAEKTGATVATQKRAVMLAEDFAILKGQKPSVFCLLGTGNPERGITAPLHSSQFDVDERALLVGARALARFVLDLSRQMPDLAIRQGT